MTAYFRRIRRTVIVEEYEGDKVKVFVLDTGYTGDRIQIVERWELSHWEGRPYSLLDSIEGGEVQKQMIKPEDVMNLHHMLGINSDMPGSRNYFFADANDESMLRLMDSGLVTRDSSPSWSCVDGVFRATKLGCRVAGLSSEVIQGMGFTR